MEEEFEIVPVEDKKQFVLNIQNHGYRSRWCIHVCDSLSLYGAPDHSPQTGIKIHIA